jgi:hypothetical protein
MTYTADQFGIYLALAIHGGTQVDFLDEDALLNSTVMADYKVVFVTQPNLPKAGIQQLAAWAKTGGRLVLSGGAAMADEYNTTETTLSSLTGCPMSPFPRRLLPAAAQQQGQFAQQQQQVFTEQGPSPIPFHRARRSQTFPANVRRCQRLHDNEGRGIEDTWALRQWWRIRSRDAGGQWQHHPDGVDARPQLSDQWHTSRQSAKSSH